jgi:hypothetical protein
MLNEIVFGSERSGGRQSLHSYDHSGLPFFRKRDYQMTRALREPDQRLIADALRDDLEAMERDVGQMSLTEALLTRLRITLGQAIDSAQTVVDHFKRRKLDGFREEVRRQPATACAISILIGMLFAAAILRR